VSLETRNFEIELFWKRSLFFWGFIASSFVAFASLYNSNSTYSLVVANFGLICSLAWTLANRGSKFWQENWEQKVDELENDVTGELFKAIEGVQIHKTCIFRARRYSVSKLAIGLSDYVTFLWLSTIIFLIAKLFNFPFHETHKKAFALLFTILTFIYAGILLVYARSSEEVKHKSPEI